MAQTFVKLSLAPFYELERWTSIKNIVGDGAVAINEFLGNTSPVGDIITKTFDKNISRDVTPTMITSGSTTITPVAFSSYAAKIPMQVFSFGLETNQYEALLRGDANLDAQVIKQVAELRSIVMNGQQDNLKKLVDLHLGTGGCLETHNDTTYSASAFSGSNFRKAVIGILGERASNLDTIVTSSVGYEQMRADNILNYAPASAVGINLFANPNVPIFDGKVVIINDTFGQESGVTPFYAFRRGVLSIEIGKTATILDSVTTAGGGTKVKQLTYSEAPYVTGTNYKVTTIDDSNIYQTASNWDLAADSSQIDLVKVTFGA